MLEENLNIRPRTYTLHYSALKKVRHFEKLKTNIKMRIQEKNKILNLDFTLKHLIKPGGHAF